MICQLLVVMLRRLHSTVVSRMVALTSTSTGPSLVPQRIRSEPSIQQKSWPSSPALDQPSHVEIPRNITSTSSSSFPKYLYDEYWWAYVNPMTIRTLHRQYLINIGLWGNVAELQDTTLDLLVSHESQKLEGETKTLGRIHGRTLQVACVYGNLAETLLQRMMPEASLHVIDVVAGSD